MAGLVQQLEIRFRIFDGTDLCQGIYPLSITIDTLKEMILSEWPKDKPVLPTSVDDLILINAGHIMHNGKTLIESRIRAIHTEVLTMHVVVKSARATPPRQRTGCNADNNGSGCCSLL